MNPLTQVKNTQKITAREAALGVSDSGSWHAKYKDSAYIYAGNFSFDLTEGDLLAVFSQYGEIVDVNLVRDKGTGKSRGFAFLAYEDQRSTILAVDNLNGASIAGRTIKVDHVANYKRKAEEDEEEEQRKREERGVCRAFQRGECTRGSSCKFSHNEQRCADTGWGGSAELRWGHDKYEGSSQKYHKGKEESDRKLEERFKHRIDKDVHMNNGKQSFDSSNVESKHHSDKYRYDKSRDLDDERRHHKYKRKDYERVRADEDKKPDHKSHKSTVAHSSDDESYRNEGQKIDARKEIDDRKCHGHGKSDRKQDRSRERREISDDRKQDRSREHREISDDRHDKRNERESRKS